ncbi:putative HAD superfamily protein/hypoxanthine phosphoribosyltransferase [Bradyrhizobium sp. GM2.2]|uniref:phosphoribosyltransferase family protein n=1 Tax=Bradyrhizobium sp. GM2.2 TaxID=3156358 RepID=UPI00339089BB
MNYRSIADLSRTIHSNLHKLPEDIDVVVGVPRSGLLAASIVALALNVRLADIDGFSKGTLLASGHTRRIKALDESIAEAANILVVDDSVNTGTSMAQAREKLAQIFPDKTITFCAIYGAKPASLGTDLILEVVPHPRLFQWNIFHHDLLSKCCVDIDGVLCVDPTDAENDDGEAYIRFLLEAQPMCTPTKRVGYLVTSRLEKYRTETEHWLRRRGIEFNQLIMLDLPTKADRQRLAAHGTFKGNIFKESDALLFIESNRLQALEIARLSGKPALCVETQEIFTPDPYSSEAIVQAMKRISKPHNVSPFLKSLARRALGSNLYDTVKKVSAKVGSGWNS